MATQYRGSGLKLWRQVNQIIDLIIDYHTVSADTRGDATIEAFLNAIVGVC